MMYDLIIIGGGPAGITAGIYAARQQLKILLLTKDFGGQIARKAVGIENYPGFPEISGKDLINKFEEHLRAQHGVEIKMDEVVKVDKTDKDFSVATEAKAEFSARAVIIASGADPRPLEVPGEKEFIGRGVSYCTVCDGPLFAGKVVAVVGGGNSAFEAALFLAKIAKKIYILERGSAPKADKTNQQAAGKSEKIEVLTSAALTEIKGKQFVDSIVYQDLGAKTTKALEVQGVFIEIGSIPATGFVKNLVEFNERDEIKINSQTCATKTAGLFAVGDVTDVKVKQIVVAAGEGCKAALGAYEYLQGR